jgi:hypothetical protein
VERKPPKNANLEFEDQPAIITPYTDSDDIQKIYNKLKFRSTKKPFGFIGKTPQFRRDYIKVPIGAIKKINMFAFVG